MKSITALPRVWLLFLHHLLLPHGATVTAQQTSAECPADQQWSYSLTTDDYPWETSWELVNIVDNDNRYYIASGPAAGNKYSRRKTYTDVVCLKNGEYQLTLKDAMGDGFCCDNGQGEWIMRLGDQIVGQVSAGQFRNRQMVFQVGSQVIATTTTTTSTTTTTVVTTTTAADVTTTTTATSGTTTVDSVLLSSSSPTSSPTTTAAPTTDPWLNFNPRHSKFCGPKVVGGFAVAVSQCGPQTMCGLTTVSNQYGSHGNDCPKGLMCYSDIVCGNGPKAQNVLSAGGRAADGLIYAQEQRVDGRTVGSVKSHDVVLEQDLGNGRWSPEEDVDALHEETGNSCSMKTVGFLLYSALVCLFLHESFVLLL
ncbi:hypothetical protein ACHAWX_006580 [Stephanocyclus meneghinianus]